VYKLKAYFYSYRKIMLASYVKLSSKGQIVIPKAIRDSLHWEVGVELTLVASEGGIILQTRQKRLKQAVTSLRGMLQSSVSPLSTTDLCQPVDIDK
jgi:AbrB family looped-hinge helix DNA binding protein